MQARRPITVIGLVTVLIALISAVFVTDQAHAHGSDEEREARIDAAVESGRITEERAAQLRERMAARAAALQARIDAAVESGRLTEERAAQLRDRMAEHERGDRHPFANRGRKQAASAPGDLRADLAETLDLTTDELRARLRAGESIAAVAQAQGVSLDTLVDLLSDQAEERIERALDDGRLTEERAAELRDGLRERIEQRLAAERNHDEVPRQDRRGRFGPFRNPGPTAD